MDELITTIGKIALVAFTIFALVGIVTELTGTDGIVSDYIAQLMTTIFENAKAIINPGQ